MKEIGILMIVAGAVSLLAGAVILMAGRLPWLGNLPGDIQLRGKNWSFAFPVVTCILVSIILTMLINLVARLFRR
jgi:Zn-dependent protease with chaperone function